MFIIFIKTSQRFYPSIFNKWKFLLRYTKSLNVLYQCLFPSSGSVGEVVINQTNYEGCQFDVHCIQCQTSIDILGIVNVFVQYVQNYFQDV